MFEETTVVTSNNFMGIYMTQSEMFKQILETDNHIEREDLMYFLSCDKSQLSRYESGDVSMKFDRTMILSSLVGAKKISLSAPGLQSNYQSAELFLSEQKGYIGGILWVRSEGYDYDLEVELDQAGCDYVADKWGLTDWHIETFLGIDRTLSFEEMERLHSWALRKSGCSDDYYS